MKSAEVAEMWEANAETWTRHARTGYDVYRDALNTPAFLAMLPPISGLHGLDVGCGEHARTRPARRQADCDRYRTHFHSARTGYGRKRSARNRLSSRRCAFFAFRRQCIRFCDGVYVDDGYYA